MRRFLLGSVAISVIIAIFCYTNDSSRFLAGTGWLVLGLVQLMEYIRMKRDQMIEELIMQEAAEFVRKTRIKELYPEEIKNDDSGDEQKDK